MAIQKFSIKILFYQQNVNMKPQYNKSALVLQWHTDGEMLLRVGQCLNFN